MKRTLLLVLALLVVPQFAYAGTQTYTTPGTYTFTVPLYNTLSVTVNGAGGGGAGGRGEPNQLGSAGASGSGSSFNGSVVGNGGGGGDGVYIGPPGTGGHPSGYIKDNGAGGATSAPGPGTPGSASGGTTNTTGGGSSGGAGGAPDPCWSGTGGAGAAGGAGGSAVKSYSALQFTPGATITVVVGTGGGGGGGGGTNEDQCLTGGGTGGSGSNGSVTITWTDNQAPAAPSIAGPTTGVQSTSYTYTFDAADPESDTLRYVVDWNSDGTADEYVPALGYVSSGTAASTTHSWSTTGSKTFKAKAQDSNGNTSGWTSYSVTISEPAPIVLLTASPSSISTGQSSTLTWSSSYATSCTGTNFSAAGATSGSASVSPTATTLYTVTCTGDGGTASDSKTVTFTCTPTNQCSGGNVVNSCTGALVQSCSYGCGAGACVAPPPPSFNSGSDGLTGHLQARPVLVPIGTSSRLYWDLSDVETCSVTGDNGDSWSGISSGTNGKTTSAISHQTVYTLSCTGTDGSSVNETETVQVVPIYQEL